jgi:hypothetical protein
MKEKSEKGKLVRFMLSDADYKALEKLVQESTCRSQSEFIRKKLLNKTIVFQQRNQSFDLLTEEMAQLKEELKALCYNVEQAVKRLKHLSSSQQAAQWLISFELDKRLLLKQVDTIAFYLKQALEKWSQESVPAEKSNKP